MKWPHEIPIVVKGALIAVLIAAALHLGFRMADDGDAPLTLIEFICVFAYGATIGPMLVGRPTED